MKSIAFLAALAALSSAALTVGAAADNRVDENLAPVAAQTSFSNRNVPIAEGEIRLDGTIRLIHAARGSLILDVTSFTLPDGKWSMLPIPRPKLVVISPQTSLNINRDVPAKPLLEELKPGMFIAAVGTDWGKGKELPAHSITILGGAIDKAGSTATTELSQEINLIGSDAAGALAADLQPSITPQSDDKERVREAALERSKVLRLAQSKIKFPYFSGGSSREKLVALTFDDGPDPRCTPLILDILNREKVPATFFVIGTKAEKYPELVLRAAAEGHDVGNHTYHHFQVTNLDSQNWRFEIGQTNQVLERILGGPSRWFRAPGCHYTTEALDVLHELRMVRVDTTANSGDSNGTGASAILNQTLSKLAPGAVILCHDRIPNTVAALPQLIRAIRQRGYRIVSLADLALRAQATPGFQPVFWPPGQGITIEGVEASTEDVNGF